MSPAYDLSQFKEEVFDGKVYYMSPSASPKHGRVISNIHFIFKSYLRGKTCEVFTDTIDVFLDKEANDKVIPDVSILCNPDQFTDKGYEGIPSLIVEVLSPTSIDRDKNIKFKKYELYGVKEYWIVDPLNRYLEQFVLMEGKYELQGIYSKLDEDELERLTQEQKDTLIKEFKTSIFDELVVRIEDIF